ncbi:hypothetical protein KSC_058110 [Ktedonobacter sp. SOSP1-52]|uniref:GNAT family N-acetyltransferase n=1 Tax=Ktedonobacter sp. SOSP1-52 TaxID=2778366 RepID=UPI00191633C8|nr:GNAT family N-acetyltransferase [Ktedonobacter sp. SOSP1-52]GHO66919.1 hypothetical protein KSC_058110 [Ktedonobacter sp. SOSP1-52]
MRFNGTVVGYALAALAGKRPPSYQAYQGELKTMYILPDYHRMGIGRNLIRAVAEHFQQEMVPSLFVGAFRDNYPFGVCSSISTASPYEYSILPVVKKGA